MISHVSEKEPRTRGEELVFLISLPRSGSTLLQKMLAVHSAVHSVAEPWLLLPMAHMLEEGGGLTCYGHNLAATAMTDLIDTMPRGREDYFDALASFVRDLYWRTQPPPRTRYFLDKTPRYYLIIPFLANAFPKAKFIFLYRNPLQVLASIINTWKSDRLRINTTHIDLYRGPSAMAEGLELLGDRALAVRYDDLVSDSRAAAERLCLYLDIAFDERMLTDYREVEFSGRMGDPEGAKQYGGISTRSLEKWKWILGSRSRIWYARHYAQSLDDRALAPCGLTRSDLLAQVDDLQVLRGGAVKDVINMALTEGRRINHRALRSTTYRGTLQGSDPMLRYLYF